MKAGVLAICVFAALAAVAEPEPNAVFGVLSDIHLVPEGVPQDLNDIADLLEYTGV